MVVGTTSCARDLKELGVAASFNVTLDMPLIFSPDEVTAVLSHWASRAARAEAAVDFGGDDDDEGAAAGGKVDDALASTMPEADAISRSILEPIGIKPLLMVLEMGRQEAGKEGGLGHAKFCEMMAACGLGGHVRAPM